MFVFGKIWRALFSWNTRFEIRPFTLLPMSSYVESVIFRCPDAKLFVLWAYAYEGDVELTLYFAML